jgi:pyruvate kinase
MDTMNKEDTIRKTKIIATIGPASDSVETIREMILAGMNVARINLSFGANDEQKERVARIRQAADQLDSHIAVMVDTRGIEIRSGKLENRKAELETGGEFVLYTDGRTGNESGASVSYKNLPNEVSPGDPILMDDGNIELRVLTVEDDTIRCQILVGGELHENKSVNLPDTQLAISMVSPEHRDYVVREMSFAAEVDAEYVAASFVQCADDIIKMRELLKERDSAIPIIAKIENRAGVNNLEEIVQVADGVMVARGDLGVELPLAEVPGTQKKIIRTTVSNGKPVITATEMLASMERNPRPTRAEASDVANAILDGSSAVMLSGETAVGRHPVEAVRTMANLAMRAEASLKEYGYLQRILPNPSNVVTEAVSQAANNMASHLNAAAIFALTETGYTARMISKHRPDCPILAITGSPMVARRLALNWGIHPILYSGKHIDEERIWFGIDRARESGFIQPGDVVVVTAGYTQQAGGTDFIRVITVG